MINLKTGGIIQKSGDCFVYNVFGAKKFAVLLYLREFVFIMDEIISIQKAIPADIYTKRRIDNPNSHR